MDLKDRVIPGDSISILKSMPSTSVDLIFADPPYNLQLEKELYRPNETRVNGVNESWDRFSSFNEYDEFSINWLRECRRILKKNASIWVIGSYHNIFRLGKVMQDLGFWILNDIVWIKHNPMPNFMGTRFNNAHETLIWASRDRDSRPAFNYQTMKTYNDDLQMRSDWYIPICQGRERIRVDGEKGHPTQKPEALLYRVLTASTKPGDTVLDPFAGTGTTLAVAARLGRHYIGIERNEAYLKIITERLKRVNPIPDNLIENPMDMKRKKIPFGSLIENGMVTPGEWLYSEDRKYMAQVLANGTLRFGDQNGSIHRISAAILNRKAWNGWNFWYVERDGKAVSIDYMRNLLSRQLEHD
ncbi:MAG: site-specific DNA-methyltransferase [Candidatus Thermoplasmatota archaeon]|nr:site-specific DNA-methyltransferase [Candidatus Thermoplasmatota archaeon]MCL5790784.1 site-specific DNA-methyltransferase [Candidatus Thermoplasmatota archaeon]